MKLMISFFCFVLTLQLAVATTTTTSKNVNDGEDAKKHHILNNNPKFPSVLLNKPHLLSSLHDKKNFVLPLESTNYETNFNNDLDGHYFFGRSESKSPEAKKKIMSKLMTPPKTSSTVATTDHKKIHDFNNDKNRELQLVGHLSDLLFQGCDEGHVYADVTYDDPYQPVCQCLLDQSTDIIWMECYLGEDCLDVNDTPDDPDDDECSGTYEIFFFHEPTGDLESKATCTICHTSNCEANNINEICTEVFFDDDHEPTDCNLIRFPNNTDEVCDECNICGGGPASSGGSYGVEHTCFDSPSNGCDTETYAHIHNFEVGPSPYDGQPDVGGLFSQICNANSLDSMLYGDVAYDNSGSALCDCEDPASGTIACDVHDPSCFANLCTTFSEIFFFNRASGDFQFKWTVGWGEDFLLTETHFNTVTGQALNCSVLQPDPITGDTVQCTDCEICESAQDGPGITFNCFGQQQDVCDVTYGRAKYNFAFTTDPTPPTPAVPIRGIYGQICSADQPERDLYDIVTYDTGFSPLCDCDDDSTPGAISCDLHDPDCSTDSCIPISEVFFFSETSGNYRFKWTIDWEDSLWTETHFSTFTGQALNCSVLESQSNRCTDCQICETDEDGPGIMFNCFGRQQSTCDATNGRATFNFGLPNTNDVTGPGPTIIPVSSPTSPPVPVPTAQPTTEVQTDNPTSMSSSSSGFLGIKSVKVLCYLVASYGLGLAYLWHH